MPYKDKTKQKEAAKDRQRKHRQVDKTLRGVTKQGVTGEGVTEYPAILHALVDPDKRKKLEKISRSLKEHNVEKLVHYGWPGMVPFDEVGELLEATK